MIFALIGAVIGLVAGGPVGLFIGGLIGFVIARALRVAAIGSLRVAQDELIETTFSVMGAMCKADQLVTHDEIQMAEQAFDMLRLDDAQRQRAKAAFNAGKQTDFDLDSAVDRFALISRRRGPLVQLFLQIQSMALLADGQIHPAEHRMLVRIATRLGMTEQDVAQLESLLRSATNGGRAAPSRDRLNDAYVALGATPESSPAEIKRAYRRLISQNHPDKLAARGLPESMRAVAEERSREINAAYDLIKTSRGFV